MCLLVHFQLLVSLLLSAVSVELSSLVKKGLQTMNNNNHNKNDTGKTRNVSSLNRSLPRTMVMQSCNGFTF